MKEKHTPFLKTIHFLSLDVAAGAVITSWMFWKLPLGETRPVPASLIALGLATWFIYLADRLLDNIYGEDEKLSARHAFFFEHQYNIQLLTIAVGIAGLVCCTFLPVNVLYPGIVLAICMAGYFFLIHKTLKLTRFFQLTKELAITVIYPVAVLGIPFYNRSSIHLSDWILAFCLTLIVFQNLLVFSFFEHREDKNAKNIIQFAGEKAAARIVRGIMFVVLFVAIFLFSGSFAYPNQLALIEVLMSLTLSFLLALPDFFQKNERYRWIGDLIFLYPLFLLFS